MGEVVPTDEVNRRTEPEEASAQSDDDLLAGAFMAAVGLVVLGVGTLVMALAVAADPAPGSLAEMLLVLSLVDVGVPVGAAIAGVGLLVATMWLLRSGHPPPGGRSRRRVALAVAGGWLALLVVGTAALVLSTPFGNLGT